MSTNSGVPTRGDYGTKLRRDLVEALLERFGFPDFPQPDLTSLNRLYKAWTRKVGYDNVQKRIYFGEGGKGPFPMADPNDLVDAVLRHGTSGSCWVVAEAFFGLLHNVGFDVRRVAGQMLNCDDPLKPNHGSVIVTIDGVEYAADPSMCGEEAIALLPGQPTQAESKIHGLWSEGNGNYWWRPGHSRVAIEYTTQFDPCTAEYFAERYEKTKEFSLFNTVLYARRNVDEGILTIGRGKLIQINSDGEMSVASIGGRDLRSVLIEQMGMSEEIVDQIPPDDGGATFGNVN